MNRRVSILILFVILVNLIIVDILLKVSPVVENSKSDLHQTKTNIILWTQCRSGSNFVGDSLAESKQFFYHEEPVKFWVLNFNGSLSNSTPFLKDMLLCHYFKYPHMNEERRYHLNIGTDIRFYQGYFLKFSPEFDMNYEMCRISNRKLFRIVHPSLQYSVPLLNDIFLKVKIVYLLRDPRGITASRSVLKNNYTFNMDVNTPMPCQRLKEDFQYIQTLRKLFPDRILVVRYEDVCEKPHQVFKKIFRFSETPFTLKDNIRLFNKITNTKSENQVNPLSIYRFSSKVPHKWRKQLDFWEVSRIQENCGKEMLFFGYKLYSSSSEYHNLSISPLRKIPSDFT